MGFFSGPNKFLVETALEIGVDNLQKTRGTDPRKLYEEVKSAIRTEPDEGMKKLYEQYIKLYEASIARTAKDTTSLKDSLNPFNWKDIGDLKKAVKYGIAGLTEKDIQALNQFALAEYTRQNSNNAQGPDSQTLDVLNKWFRLYEGRTVVETEDETLIQNNSLYIKENALVCNKVVDDAKKATRYVFSGTTLDILALIQETFTVGNNLSPQARKNNVLTLQKAIQCTPIDGKITDGTMSSISTWIASLEKSTSLPGIANEQQAIQEHATRNRLGNNGSTPTNGGIAPNSTPSIVSNTPTIPGETRRADGLPEPQRYTETPFSMSIAIPPFVENLLGISGTDIASAPPNRAPDAMTDNVRFWKGSEGKDTRGYLYFSRKKMLYQGDVKNNQMDGKGVITTESMHYIGSVKDGVIAGPGTLIDKAGGRVYIGDFKEGKLVLGKVYNLSGETLERLNGTPTTPADGDNVPAVTAPENVPASPAENIKKSFETAYGDIMTVAKGADKWFWDQTDATVKANREKMGNAYANFQKALSSIDKNTLSPADRADVEKKVRDVALYFSDSLKGISNSHFRNYELSAGLLIGLLDRGSSGKAITGWPKGPTEQEILKKLKGTEGGNLILAQMNAGAKFQDIIANPKIKGEWETVTKEIYGNYQKELISFIKSLDEKQSNGKLILTVSQQQSLKDLIALTGSGTGWDFFSAQTKDSIISIGKAAPAILAGGVIASTGIGAGPGAFLIAAGVGGLITTGGMMIAQNRLYTDTTEIAKEASLNTLTFGAGGVLFRIGGKYMSISKGLHYTNMGLLQPLGNVVIAASTDVLRGQFEKTDVRFRDAFWHELPWALLPLALAGKGWKWTPTQVEGAKRVEEGLKAVERKAALGADTKADTAKLEQQVAAQGTENKAHVQSQDSGVSVTGKPLPPNPIAPKPTQKETGNQSKTNKEWLEGKDHGDMLFVEGKDGATKYLLHRKPNGSYELHEPPSTSSNTSLEEMAQGLLQDAKRQPVKNFDNTEEALKYLGNENLTVKGIDFPHASGETPAVTKTGSAPQSPHTNESAAPKSAELSGADKVNLTKSLERKFDALKNDGDSINLGRYTVTKDGKNYRVKQEGEGGGEWIKNKKDAFTMVESGLADSLEHAQATIRSAVQEGVQAFPKGKSKDYTWNGEKYTMKKSVKGDDVEVVGRDGKILSGKDLESFYADQAGSILNTNMNGFLGKFGGQKAFHDHGPDGHGNHTLSTHVELNPWKDWNSQRNVLIKVPSEIARRLTKMTINEALFPVRTLEAFKNAVTTPGSVLGISNNVAKAIVLADTNMGWGAGVGRIAGRGVLLSGAAAVPLDYMFGENNAISSNIIKTINSFPYILAGTPESAPGTTATGALSTYYGGMIWGSMISRYIAGGGKVSTGN